MLVEALMKFTNTCFRAASDSPLLALRVCFDSRAKITLKPVKKLKFSKLVMVPPPNKAVPPKKKFEN